MICVKQKAYAKINLGLDVLGLRDDGYHDVSMIMQTINLYDELSLEKTRDGKIDLNITSVAEGVLPEGEELSDGPDNLCVKAARLILTTAAIKDGVSINLKKNIPIAAGLGGGSSDAAAVLLAIDRLFSLNYSKQKLATLAIKIGADVPYCVFGNTMLAEGIGERLTAISRIIDMPLVLSRPNIAVSTKEVYTALDATEDITHPDIPALSEAIDSKDIERISSAVGNILEAVTIPAHPAIDGIKDHMKARGALCACMSGSGPSVFGIFRDAETADECAASLRESFPDCYAISTKTINK